jgi:probable phosphoglycerate mutase
MALCLNRQGDASMAPMRLILIRHGQTPADVAYTLHATLPGPGLTRLGQQQAVALPVDLAGPKM